MKFSITVFLSSLRSSRRRQRR